MERPLVLFAMAEVGLGHKRPAEAIASALANLAGSGVAVEVVDLGAVSGASRTDGFIKRAWKKASGQPIRYRLLYDFLELVHPMGRLYPRAAFADYLDLGARYLASKRPALVVATYTLCAMAAKRARDRHGLACPIAVDVVDPFDAYSWWAEPGADLFIVHSDRAARRLGRLGVRKDRIRILGFPVAPPAPSFDAAGDPDRVRGELGLGGDRPLVLASGGGEGLGAVAGYVKALCGGEMGFDLVFVAGKNKAALADVRDFAAVRGKGKGEGLFEFESGRLRVLGFTDDMIRLLRAADLFVGKAGASSAMEALVVGVPVAFTDWIAQNDGAIVEWFQSRGFGWKVPHPRSAAEFVRRLVRSGDLARAGAAIREAGFSSGVVETARELLKLISRER